MIPAIALLGAAAILWLYGHWRARRTARRVLSRFTRGQDGIIIGAEPIRHQGSNGAGILLIHGCGDTPQTLRHLADAFIARGYAVEAPLLPGHGRDLESFDNHSADDWFAAVEAAFDVLAARTGWTGVFGLSMGGALATHLAAERDEVRALVLASPYFAMPTSGAFLARTARLWRFFVPVLNTASEKSILDPAARAESLGYGAFTARSMLALSTTALRGLFSLQYVDAPTLVVQSTTDNRVSTETTRRAFELLSSEDKELHWIENAGHVITVDRGWEQVASLAVEWMERHRLSMASETRVN
jgi:carboxylesterase